MCRSQRMEMPWAATQAAVVRDVVAAAGGRRPAGAVAQQLILLSAGAAEAGVVEQMAGQFQADRRPARRLGFLAYGSGRVGVGEAQGGFDVPAQQQPSSPVYPKSRTTWSACSGASRPPVVGRGWKRLGSGAGH
jgi:hypothetical protein